VTWLARAVAFIAFNERRHEARFPHDPTAEEAGDGEDEDAVYTVGHILRGAGPSPEEAAYCAEVDAVYRRRSSPSSSRRSARGPSPRSRRRSPRATPPRTSTTRGSASDMTRAKNARDEWNDIVGLAASPDLDAIADKSEAELDAALAKAGFDVEEENRAGQAEHDAAVRARPRAAKPKARPVGRSVWLAMPAAAMVALGTVEVLMTPAAIHTWAAPGTEGPRRRWKRGSREGSRARRGDRSSGRRLSGRRGGRGPSSRESADTPAARTATRARTKRPAGWPRSGSSTP
jgi:hypothetical protein